MGSWQRQQHPCTYYFVFMVMIMCKLTLTFESQESRDENDVIINSTENVISQNKYSDEIVTTLMPPTSTSRSANTMTRYEINDIMNHNAMESTIMDIELSVTTSSVLDDELDTINYNDCNIMPSETDGNFSNFRNHFGKQTLTYPLTTYQGANVTVGDFTFVNFTDSSLTVAWKPPKNDTISTYVRYYVLEWSRSGNLLRECRISNETFSYTINNLTPCTKYDVGVTPFIDNKLGGKTMGSAKTILTVNKDMLKPHIDRGEYWLKSSWNLPNNECISHYDVTYCQHTTCKTVNVSTTYYNATDLMSCTEYNFTIAFHGESNNFGNLSFTDKTNFHKPGPPRSVWTIVGQNSMNILWNPPFDAACVMFYQVTISYDDKFQKANTSATNYEFYQLQSCSIYEVIVNAVDNKGSNITAESIQSNQTLAPVPQSPLMELYTSKNDTIILNWFLRINKTNNCSNFEITSECIVVKVLGDGYMGQNGMTNVNISGGNGQITIRGLTPYTNYSCESIARNSEGKSNTSTPLSVITADYVPSPPTPNVYNITHERFTIKWDKPTYLPGELTLFEIMLTWYYPFHRPQWCEKISTVTENVRNISGEIFEWKYDKIKPYSKYNIKIKAKTRAGWGSYSDGTEFQTWPGAPGPVSNMKFFTKESPINSNILEPFLTWGRPCLINADDIQYFNVTAIGHRLDFQPHRFTAIIDGSSSACRNDTCTYTFKNSNLREEYNYQFFIAGIVANAPQLGEIAEIKGIFPAGIPPAPNENYTNQIKIDPFKIRRTTTTAAILLPLFSNDSGDIRCYAIIVSKSGYSHENSSRLNLTSGEWPDIASWYESMIVEFKIPYQAAKFCQNLNPSYITDYGKFKAVKFVIGEDTETCPELSSNQHERSYCNGPLKPDTWYDVRMRAFTNGGYRDSIKFTIKTNAELQVAVVIGTIFGILFLGILITTVLLIRKCSIHAVLRRFLHSDMPGSPVPTPFNRRKFIAHCQELADNPGKLSNEFQLLQTLSVDLQMPTNTACLQANRKKNRYTDILPYDFSRVKLEASDNDPYSDYINASFIKGCNGEEEYIACQGPKEETTYDFWRMIDQYDIKLIVMLTQLMEKNKEKCHQYYPTIRETFTYENISIRCSSELDYRTYTQRTLILQKDNEKRTIIHLHFKDWPDHDVPEDFDAMINFCQIMRRYMVVNHGLVVIHCSAGIGRTGTLIAIDILLQCIKENRKLDVFGTVYRLRHHRINMVQRESQYAYIYNCIKQVLKNPYFSKSYKPPSVDPIRDNNSNNRKKTNSMMNLVNNHDTLKDSPLSTCSIKSGVKMYESTSSICCCSEKSSDNCLSLRGVGFSKSTSEIYCKAYGEKIGFLERCNTIDFGAIFKSNKRVKQKLSLMNLEKCGDSVRRSIYENFHQLNRVKLERIMDIDSAVNEKLLDDTSL